MNEILEFIYNRLVDQLSDDYGIYDHVPQDLGASSYPFVKYAVVRTDNDDTVSETGFSAILRVTGYSRYRGFSELATMADAITAALNNWDMANTATYAVGTFKENFRQYLTGPDGLTRNSVQEFTFYYEPI